jgi:hypothetical protein
MGGQQTEQAQMGVHVQGQTPLDFHALSLFRWSSQAMDPTLGGMLKNEPGDVSSLPNGPMPTSNWSAALWGTAAGAQTEQP